MFRPQKLGDAIFLAKQEEARTQLGSMGSKVGIQKGIFSNSSSSKGVGIDLNSNKGVPQSQILTRNNRTVLSRKEINDRIMKGL